MPDPRKPLTIDLSAGMASNVEDVATQQPMRSENVRWMGDAPEGTIDTADTLSDSATDYRGYDLGGVALIPRDGEVAVATKAGVHALHRRAGGTWSMPRSEELVSGASQSVRAAQNWAPMGVTAGGIIYAGGDNEIVRHVESVLLKHGDSSYLVSAVTVLRRFDETGLSFVGRQRVILRIQDPKTGATLIEDTELASAQTASGTAGCICVGAMPNGSIWWGEYDSAGPTWTVKYVKVAVNETAPSITVSAPVTAKTFTRGDTHLAVTQAVDDVVDDYNPATGGTTDIVYMGYGRSSDLRMCIEAWDTSADATVWTYADASYTMQATLNSQSGLVGVYNGGGAVDIAAGHGYVGFVALTQTYRATLTSCDIATQAAASRSTALFQASTGYTIESVGVTPMHNGEALSTDRWLCTCTYEDASGAPLGNPTPNFTQQRRMDTKYVYNLGGTSYSHDMVAGQATGHLRPFTAYDPDADADVTGTGIAPHKYVPFVPVSKAPRGYHATDSPLGYRLRGAGSPDDWLPHIDPAIEVCSWNITRDTQAANTHRLHPCARVGVGRAITPMNNIHSIGCATFAKPHSIDGHRFALAYPADIHTHTDIARNARYAIVDTEDVPATVESDHGVTYVASGGLFTWDGLRMHEATPLPIPRLRAELWTTDPSYLPDATYYLNASYVFLDEAGNVHRGPPNPSNLEFAVTGGPRAIEVFVDEPLSTRDGLSLRPIGVELYLGTSANNLQLLTNGITGQVKLPATYSWRELRYEVYLPPYTHAPSAWWLGLEQKPSALPACRDVAVVGDRLWVITSEEGRVRYSKPRADGYVYEFADAGELRIGTSHPVALEDLAGRPLVFTETDAWTVYGDGPNANGVGAFTLTQRVLRMGAVDRRLVLSTPAGVVFKSKRGWFIVGPDYSPRPWGSDVRDLLDGYSPDGGSAVAMTLREETGEVLVLRRTSQGSSDPILSWQWAANKWSILPSDSAATDIASTDSQVYALDGVGTAGLEVHHTMVGNTGSAVIETHWVKPAGVEGSASFHEVIYTGRRLGAHDLTIDVYADYDGTNIEQVISYSASDVTDALDGTHVTLRADLGRKHMRAVKFRLSSTSPDQWRPSALTVTAKARPGVQRRAGGRK